MGHEQLTEIGAALRAHAPALTKVRTASYAATGARDPEVAAMYAKGEFVASHRCMLGSLADLADAITAAGFHVRGTRTAHDHHVVIFDI